MLNALTPYAEARAKKSTSSHFSTEATTNNTCAFWHD